LLVESRISFAVIAIFLIIYVVGKGSEIALSSSDSENISCENEYQSKEQLWIDTIMYTGQHAFGYSGDVSMWEGWYYDTIPVGDDIMLNCDSIAPSVIRLSLITRELAVNLNEFEAAEKIKSFLNPINGFKRVQKKYKELLDSIVSERYGTLKCTGYFSFTVDYADTCQKNANIINRFICDLSGVSQNESVKVPGLTAFYAGFNPQKHYRPVYSRNENDMLNLSNFLANKTFENWKRDGETDQSSNAATLEIRTHIVNSDFVTLSDYEYERIGTGHGMYTERFHTLDLSTGKELLNNDIFKSNSKDNVKLLLFECMANDPRYIEWNPQIKTAEDVESNIEAWQSPGPLLEGTEWEDPNRDFKFELPEGALTNTGVIFSFQPYEIDCWAAGAYHFIVPYKKLMPYLTPNVKKTYKQL